MKKLWYVSVTSASTAAAPHGMRDIERLTPNVAAALLAACMGCGGSTALKPAATETAATSRSPAETPGARNANLTGARCARGSGAPCTCRNRNADPAETPPPDARHKRFEIRLSAQDGTATLDSPTLGHFAASDGETCFYADVLSGATSDLVFSARESNPGQGVGPALEINEYGAKGPWWYRILEVRCAGPGGKCNRDAADDWGREIKTRQRGRIDPCGSTVITRLGWETTGGTGDPELGLFRDFIVSFTMEVKRFTTEFHPGATECVPK